MKGEPTRVLHLLSSSGLYGSDQVVLNLGQSKHLVSFVGALNNSHNPHLEVIEEARKRGLRTVVFDSRGRADFRTVAEIKSFLKENRIDILHTHGYKSDVVGFFAALSSRTKWVATNHVWHGLGLRLKLYEGVDGLVLRFARRVVAVSREIKGDLIARKIPAGKIHVIDNGIDVERFMQPRSVERLRTQFGIHDDDFVVTIVGRLAPEKGHATFLKAAGQISAHKERVKFLIVGDGRLRDELRAEAARLNLNSHAIFTGFCSDMPAVYGLSHVIVNASSIEGLPMTILEAMASKVPVIATRAGAIPDVIKDDETGLLVDADDAETLRAKIESLIDDHCRRRRLADAAFAFVASNHSCERMCDAYRQVYQEVLSAS